jgi:hypothetical protein
MEQNHLAKATWTNLKFVNNHSNFKDYFMNNNISVPAAPFLIKILIIALIYKKKYIYNFKILPTKN